MQLTLKKLFHFKLKEINGNEYSGLGFCTQANLVIQKADTRALNVIPEVLKTDFQCAEITEVLYADESNPQVNMNINEKLGTC